MSNNNFFFCYDRKLARYLYSDKMIRYITHAIHPKTRQDFWLFDVHSVKNAIDEYNDCNNKDGDKR